MRCLLSYTSPVTGGINITWAETGQFTMQEAGELLEAIRDVREEEKKALDGK